MKYRILSTASLTARYFVIVSSASCRHGAVPAVMPTSTHTSLSSAPWRTSHLPNQEAQKVGTLKLRHNTLLRSLFDIKFTVRRRHLLRLASDFLSWVQSSRISRVYDQCRIQFSSIPISSFVFIIIIIITREPVLFRQWQCVFWDMTPYSLVKTATSGERTAPYLV